jgi:hypothetical protein
MVELEPVGDPHCGRHAPPPTRYLNLKKKMNKTVQAQK